jgi:hypothetical protein
VATQARAWRRRWRLLDAVVREERRRQTPRERCAAMLKLHAFGPRRGRTRKEQREIAAVRRRWVKLHEILGPGK